MKPQAKQHKKICYSQCGEDLIINHILKGRGIAKPRYLDIGAHHPWYINNTAYFYQKGSSGINIEPDPVLFKPFPKQRKRDVNLNVGIAPEAGEADFYVMAVPTLNTFSKADAEKFEKEDGYAIKKVLKLPLRTYAQVVDEHLEGKAPDLLSVDVEGLDFEIIKSIDYQKLPPTILCVETISYSETGHGEKNQELIGFMKSKGYLLYADTYINSIFVLENFWRK